MVFCVPIVVYNIIAMSIPKQVLYYMPYWPIHSQKNSIISVILVVI